MRSLNKKGSEKTINTIITMVLMLASLALITGILVTVFTVPSIMRTSGALSCYFANGLASSATFNVLPVIPSLCDLNEVEDPVDMDRLSELMVTGWFMYGKGKWDNNLWEGEVSRPVYTFKVAEEFSLNDLYQYLAYHATGVEVDLDKSDYAYLQKGSVSQTICIDSEIKESGVVGGEMLVDPKFKPGTKYYLLFYDDKLRQECGDKLVISLYPNYDQGEPYFCPTYATGTTIIIKDRECLESGWGGA